MPTNSSTSLASSSVHSSSDSLSRSNYNNNNIQNHANCTPPANTSLNDNIERNLSFSSASESNTNVSSRTTNKASKTNNNSSSANDNNFRISLRFVIGIFFSIILVLAWSLPIIIIFDNADSQIERSLRLLGSEVGEVTRLSITGELQHGTFAFEGLNNQSSREQRDAAAAVLLPYTSNITQRNYLATFTAAVLQAKSRYWPTFLFRFVDGSQAISTDVTSEIRQIQLCKSNNSFYGAGFAEPRPVFGFQQDCDVLLLNRTTLAVLDPIQFSSEYASLIPSVRGGFVRSTIWNITSSLANRFEAAGLGDGNRSVFQYPPAATLRGDDLVVTYISSHMAAGYYSSLVKQEYISIGLLGQFQSEIGPQLREFLPPAPRARAYLTNIPTNNRVVAASHGAISTLVTFNSSAEYRVDENCFGGTDAGLRVYCFYNISAHPDFYLLRGHYDRHEYISISVEFDFQSSKSALNLFLPTDFYLQPVEDATRTTIIVIVVLVVAGFFATFLLLRLVLRRVEVLACEMGEDPFERSRKIVQERKQKKKRQQEEHPGEDIIEAQEDDVHPSDHMLLHLAEIDEIEVAFAELSTMIQRLSSFMPTMKLASASRRRMAMSGGGVTDSSGMIETDVMDDHQDNNSVVVPRSNSDDHFVPAVSGSSTSHSTSNDPRRVGMNDNDQGQSAVTGILIKKNNNNNDADNVNSMSGRKSGGAAAASRRVRFQSEVINVTTTSTADEDNNEEQQQQITRLNDEVNNNSDSNNNNDSSNNVDASSRHAAFSKAQPARKSPSLNATQKRRNMLPDSKCLLAIIHVFGPREIMTNTNSSPDADEHLIKSRALERAELIVSTVMDDLVDPSGACLIEYRNDTFLITLKMSTKSLQSRLASRFCKKLIAVSDKIAASPLQKQYNVGPQKSVCMSASIVIDSYAKILQLDPKSSSSSQQNSKSHRLRKSDDDAATASGANEDTNADSNSSPLYQQYRNVDDEIILRPLTILSEWACLCARFERANRSVLYSSTVLQQPHQQSHLLAEKTADSDEACSDEIIISKRRRPEGTMNNIHKFVDRYNKAGSLEEEFHHTTINNNESRVQNDENDDDNAQNNSCNRVVSSFSIVLPRSHVSTFAGIVNANIAHTVHSPTELLKIIGRASSSPVSSSRRRRSNNQPSSSELFSASSDSETRRQQQQSASKSNSEGQNDDNSNNVSLSHAPFLQQFGDVIFPRSSSFILDGSGSVRYEKDNNKNTASSSSTTTTPPPLTKTLISNIEFYELQCILSSSSEVVPDF